MAVSRSTCHCLPAMKPAGKSCSRTHTCRRSASRRRSIPGLSTPAKKLVLVDTGGGKNFAPTLGRLPQNLAAAGVSLDAGRCRRASHTCTRITLQDCSPPTVRRCFKNAVVHVNGEDHALLDLGGNSREGAGGIPRFLRHGEGARSKPYADAGKLQMTRTALNLRPACVSVFTPGHTVGHTMVRVSSGKDDFLIWGDIVHCAALQFADPERSVGVRHRIRRCALAEPPEGVRHGARPTACCLPARTCRSRASAARPNPAPATPMCRCIYSELRRPAT